MTEDEYMKKQEDFSEKVDVLQEKIKLYEKEIQEILLQKVRLRNEFKEQTKKRAC